MPVKNPLMCCIRTWPRYYFDLPLIMHCENFARFPSFRLQLFARGYYERTILLGYRVWVLPSCLLLVKVSGTRIYIYIHMYVYARSK